MLPLVKKHINSHYYFSYPHPYLIKLIDCIKLCWPHHRFSSTPHGLDTHRTSIWSMKKCRGFCSCVACNTALLNNLWKRCQSNYDNPPITADDLMVDFNYKKKKKRHVITNYYILLKPRHAPYSLLKSSHQNVLSKSHTLYSLIQKPSIFQK